MDINKHMGELNAVGIFYQSDLLVMRRVTGGSLQSNQLFKNRNNRKRTYFAHMYIIKIYIIIPILVYIFHAGMLKYGYLQVVGEGAPPKLALDAYVLALEGKTWAVIRTHYPELMPAVLSRGKLYFF